jgi:hypothetical protein
MALPEQHLQRRRLQILDDETRDGHGFNVHEYEDTWVHEDSWVKDFIARLTGLVRKIGGKN